jgi:hypothetical protein
VFAEAVPPQNVLNLLLKRQPELVRDRECDKTALAVWSEQYKFLTTVRDWQKVPVPSDRQELYNIFEDPKETLNLRDILPEQVEMLSDCLQALIRQTPVTPTVAEAATNYNDPQVYRRLRDLGYLE